MPAPLIVGGLVASGALGLGQGLYNAFRRDPAQRYNREELERLKKLREQGQLGLSGTDQRLMYAGYYEPVNEYARQAQQTYERMAAAQGGNVSGAHLAQLRRESARTTAEGQLGAARNVAAANEAERRRQLEQIDQRTAADSRFRQDRAQAAFGALSQAAGATAALGAEHLSGTGPLDPLVQLRKRTGRASSRGGLPDADRFESALSGILDRWER